jgi:hypothetical protein
MRISTLLIVPIALSGLLAAACSGSSSAQPTSTPAPDATWLVQTGIAPVDGFLNLMAGKSLDAIAGRTAFEPIACDTDRPVDGPLLACDESEADGTVVEAIVRGCFPSAAIRSSEFAERMDWLAGDNLTLETVYEVDGGAAAFAVALERRGTTPDPAYTRFILYLTDDGRLTGYDSCGEFTEPRYTSVQVWP